MIRKKPRGGTATKPFEDEASPQGFSSPIALRQITEIVRLLGSGLTLSDSSYFLKTSRRCQARWAGSGRRVAWGAKESGRPWRSASLKCDPPGRMDSAMSDLDTRIRRLSSTVQRPASKRSWAVGVSARPLSGVSGPRLEWAWMWAASSGT